ncbi:hypothetical protein UA08_05462 [Talaromyces atroroseus]|uniref:Enoyl reductase (ER) domain-containing protein n=1 Tax=Talaromyces atroroseus TaxID=1441469 RepID=A0A225ACX4_TALAT|nr:hypothetical protein UA08_05462 [Talaromyces atroroseus]OKL59001.1 hypothetical protein UA08_05462 [Talaromyces atroroseus]
MLSRFVKRLSSRQDLRGWKEISSHKDAAPTAPATATAEYKISRNPMDVTYELPSTMKAQYLDDFNTPYVLRDGVPVPVPTHPYDVLIRVDAASYCHTDFVLASGRMSSVEKPVFPHVGCHEFSGTVVALPPNSVQADFKIGDRVGASCRPYHACGECVECVEESTPDSDPKGSSVLCPLIKSHGIGIPGGWQEYVLVDSRQLALIPPGLTQVEAAPLMCAGVTIFAAIKKTGLKPGQRIGIIGCGGGLGHLGLQYATALGFKVYGVENSDRPLALAKSLNNISGATIVDARMTTAAEAIASIGVEDGRAIPGQFGLDAVIILAESQTAFQYGVDMLKNHGKCVVVSFPPGGFHTSSLDLIFRDITFVGNVSGSIKQLREMTQFSAKHGIKAQMKIFQFEQLNELVETYLSGHGGKLVIDYHLSDNSPS